MSEFDLFVSYARKDNEKGRVDSLIDKIKRDFAAVAGRPLKDFFDKRDINGDTDWRMRIQQSLRESHLFLAIFTPNYIKSEYCQWEFMEFRNHEIGRGMISDGVVPVYFIELPSNDKTFEQKAEKWVEELGRRNRFELRPWFHHGEEALHTLALDDRIKVALELEKLRDCLVSRVKRAEVVEKKKGQVDTFNVHFCGRATEMRVLQESLTGSRMGVISAVQGLGGIGKTTLAVAYAHTFASDYPAGSWQIKCEGQTDLRLALKSLVGMRDFLIKLHEDEEKNLDLAFQRVLSELKARADAAPASPSGRQSRVLFILDNVDHAELLAPHVTKKLSSEGWLHLLATTRLGSEELGQHPDRALVPIDQLAERDAVDLIEKWQPKGKFSSEAEQLAATEIARLLDGFTLAVEGAAVYLGLVEKHGVTCVKFLALLQRAGLEGLEKAISKPSVHLEHNEKRLSATLQPTLDALSPQETIVLTYAALLAADNVVDTWLRPLVAAEFPELGQEPELGEEDPWQVLKGRLLSLRLWQLSGDTRIFRMHRLVQELVRKRVAADQLEKCQQALLSYVKTRSNQTLEFWLKDENDWELTPLATTGLHWMRMEKESVKIAGTEVANVVALEMLSLGRATEAKPIFFEVLKVRQALFAGDHPDVATSLNNLAGCKKDLGDAEGAMVNFQSAHAIYQRLFKGDHPDVARSLNNVAGCQQALGDAGGAMVNFQSAHAMYQRLFKGDHPDVATSLNNVASCQQDLGDAEGAMVNYQAALDMRKRLFKGDHPSLARSLNNVAYCQKALGDAEGAMVNYQEALALNQRFFKGDHPDVANSLNNLAWCQQALGDAEGAMVNYQAALAMRHRLFKGDHPDVATSLNSVASCQQALGDAEGAMVNYQAARAMRQRLIKGDHPDVASSLNNVASCQQALGDAEGAMVNFQAALEMLQRLIKGDHPDVASLLNNVASCQKDLGNAEGAMVNYQAALEMLQRLFKGDHPVVASLLNNVASCQQALGGAEGAMVNYQAALAMRHRLFKGDHPDMATSLNNVASCQEDLGDAEGAMVNYQAALAMRQRLIKGDHPDVASLINNVAGCQYALGDAEGAMVNFQAALAMRQRLYKGDHPDVATSLNNVAGCQHALGDAEGAIVNFQAALAIYQRLIKGDHPDVARSLNNVALCKQDLGDAEGAMVNYQAALAMRQRLFKGDHPDVARSLNNVAYCQQDLGYAEGAMVNYQAALAMRQRLFKGDHRDLVISLKCIAYCLRALRR